MTERMTAVAKMVEKWREEAGYAEINALEADSIGLHDAAKSSDRRAKLLTECADELTAALSPAELGGVEFAWRLAGTEKRPIDPEPDVRVHKAPKPIEWETLYRWEATIAAITKNGKPPVSTPRAAEAEWLPIESAPKANGLYVVYTPDLGDGERYGFDYYEDGVWLEHAEAYDHYIAVGGAGAAGPDCVCTGPGPSPDYTHWRALTPPSAKGE